LHRPRRDRRHRRHDQGDEDTRLHPRARRTPLAARRGSSQALLGEGMGRESAMGERWVSIYGPNPLPATGPAKHLADGNQLLHGVSRTLAGIDEHKTNVLVMVIYHANGGVMTAVDLEKSSDESSLGAGLDVAWEKSGVADEAIQLVILGIRVSLG